MPRDRQSAGSCPQCTQGALQCTYNLFQQDELRIDSWEHKCVECGFRETRAFRSDEPDASEEANEESDRCPYCGRKAGAV